MLNAFREMPCSDLYLLLACGGELVLEGVRCVLLGHGAYFGISGCDQMRLWLQVCKEHRRCGRWAHLRVPKRAMDLS